MTTVKILNIGTLKTEDGKVDVDVSGIDNKKSSASLSYVINWQNANSRNGSASTKIMSEISGTTKKPFKQKGTGNARQGSLRSVQFRGGRTCFGPLPRDFGYTMPKKIVRKVVSEVIGSKIAGNKLMILKDTASVELSANTLNKKLASAGVNNAVFVYNDAKNVENFIKSLRNLKGFKSVAVEAINAYDMLNHDFVLIEDKAFEKVKEVLKCK